MKLQTRIAGMLVLALLLGDAQSRAQAKPAATTASAPAPNLVTNGGFEQGMIGWAFMPSGAVGSGEIDKTVHHTGEASIKLTNQSAFAPNVYLRLYQVVGGLTPYTTYRISGWVKGQNSGICWIGGGPGWLLRQHFPKGTFDWKEISADYTTGADGGALELLVCTESPTDALWVDDVRVEAIHQDTEKLRRLEIEFNETLEKNEQRLASLKETLPADRPDDPYVKAGLTVAEYYLKRVRDPKSSDRQSRGWSMLQLEEVGQVLDETEKLAKSQSLTRGHPLAWPTEAPAVVRDGVFVVPTKTGEGAQPQSAEPRPWYFYGYGHFDQPQKDMPIWRALGVSLVQDGRVGPSAMNADGSLRDNALTMLRDLHAAIDHGVRTDFLISPHYFPDWAIQQAKDLPNGNGGFIGYNIDHPLARKVNQTWLETMLPRMKDAPALLSMCLSNEPVYMMSGHDPYSRPKFSKYLAERHGEIGTLNALYGTSYKSFDEVAVPPHGMPAEVEKQRAYYDWCRFNMHNFADWHAWLRDIAHKILPGIPTHAKIMVFLSFDRDKLHWGIDPELMCNATDLAGCDAYAFPAGDQKSFDWHGHAFWYDLLNSFGNQPVFNSENHIIPDGYPPVHIPMTMTRAQFWQDALHHQGETTTWVWEEQSHPSLSGSIFFRPANVFGASRAMIDMNRLAGEVTAINRAPARVAILYSPSSLFWEPRYAGTAHSLYNQLTFSGEKITFVSEKQLSENTAAKVRVILLPHATHLTDDAVRGLEAFIAGGGKVLRLGDDDLAFDEYHRPRQLSDALKSLPTVDQGAKDEPARAQALRKALEQQGLKPQPLENLANKASAWCVEYRIVPHEQATLVPMINFNADALEVSLPLQVKGKPIDLLSGQAVDLAKLKLEPMVPMLIRVEQ